MKTSILYKMSSDDFDRRELDTKNHGIVPNWWKGVTTLALTAVERFEKQYLALQKGWHITCNPEELLEKFNASQSDAHSLECGDFERLNEDWKKFCRNENYYNSPFIKIHPHAEKQRTDDRDIKQAITQMKEAAENNRVGWNFPNEHYIEYTAIIMTCDDLLEFISGQIPAKENKDYGEEDNSDGHQALYGG